MFTSHRILHIMRAPVGGLFRHVLDLAAAQAERGHHVGIVADSSTADRLTVLRFKSLEPHLSIGVHLMPINRKPGLGDLLATRQVAFHADRVGAAILHGHGAKGGAYARLAGRGLAAKGSRVATFYTPHGGVLNFKPGTLEASFYHNTERALAQMTTGIIFESAFARRMFADYIGLQGIASRVIPNGLHPADFNARPTVHGAADFVFIGELREVKGIDVLLRALATLNATRRTTAVIVGSGPDAASLRALAGELGLANVVRFPGALPAREALPLGQCLLVPSRKESFPYVVLEGAAAGMPILATSVGGIPEIMAAEVDSLLPAGDDRALADAMTAHLADPEPGKARARRLKAFVAERFTVEAMTEQVLGFYDDAAARSHSKTGAGLGCEATSPATI